MALNPVCCVKMLVDQVKTKAVRLIDASYVMGPRPSYEDFKRDKYGKFEELIKEEVAPAYLEEHGPGAIHVNLNAACYPGKYEKFGIYEPQLFEKYVRLLGINKDDHLVVYSRGPMAGMLFASKVWWLFRLYGHEKVQVLSGGWDAWKKAGGDVEKDVPKLAPGNWSASAPSASSLIGFDELHAGFENGTSLFQHFEKINYLDARSAGQFSGAEPLGFPAVDPRTGEKAKGAHIRAARSLPAGSLVGPDGIVSKDLVKEALTRAGFDPALPTVTSCNGGVQAAFLSLALASVGIESRLYNGSMSEVAQREPLIIDQN